ncbi:MAG: DUF4097 family beta strand repeat-containing protein [Cyclobacteriaceae bacterium]|nr:DUF4097 family beta strand repeat protein [Cyclobacteriaceae bacterium]
MKNFNKIVITTIMVLWLSVVAIAQQAGEFPVPLTDPAKRGSLYAKLNTGSITVKGTARKDVLVKYSQRPERKHDRDDDDDDDNENRKDNKGGLRRISGGTMDLEVSENNNNVRVTSESWSNAVDLVIEVPTGMDMKVKAYNDGDIIVADVEGAIEITNYNGEITARGISGSVVASTYNGEIKIAFNKVIEGTPMSFSTYNGDIDLTFPSTLKATLKMKTEQGEIYSGFEMNLIKTGPIQKKETKSGNFKVVIDDWVKGDVNGGGPEFTMKNYNGDILIRKK